MVDTLSFKKQPQDNYLCNNPIVIELAVMVRDAIEFEVTVSGKPVYSGLFIPTGISPHFEASVSISDIIKPYLGERSIVNDNDLIGEVRNSCIQIYVLFRQRSSIGTSVKTFTSNVYKGGVGKKMLRYLKGKNTDIFTYKLLNPDGQFFLTTRTSGRHIVIKENELCPLYFIAADKAYTIVTEYINTFTFPALTAGNLYAFNIEVLRRLSYNSYRKIPSYLGVLVDGKFVFDITIKAPAKSPNKYLIRFLNSFSAYEKLEVTGKAVSEPEFAEDKPFMIYDQSIDDYIEQKNRLSIREVIKADFGYKSLEEFLFMRDMLQSDKCFLIDPDGNEQKVHVSCENFSHDLFPTEPGSVQLIIRLADSNSNYSPDIDESLPDFNFGEAIWIRGATNGYGFLFADSILNTL
jgi:hypothetical protein